MFHSSRATCTGVGAPLGHNRGVAMVPQSLAREQQNSALFARHRAATIDGARARNTLPRHPCRAGMWEAGRLVTCVRRVARSIASRYSYRCVPRRILIHVALCSHMSRTRAPRPNADEVAHRAHRHGRVVTDSQIGTPQRRSAQTTMQRALTLQSAPLDLRPACTQHVRFVDRSDAGGQPSAAGRLSRNAPIWEARALSARLPGKDHACRNRASN